MSASEQGNRPRLPFTEFFNLVRIFYWAFQIGLAVIVYSEVYLYFTDKPRPLWLSGLENVYVGAWTVTKTVVIAAFSSGVSQAARDDPNCAVDLVRFNMDGSESGRWTYIVKNLTALPEQATAGETVWQKIELKASTGKGATGWVSKADWDTKHARPACE